jgi:predicted dehydrogenase/threonine dehydrogenase-like Zn-dependent dehydrogenase
VKQIAQNYKTGDLSLLEVPVPACRPGGVVVRTEYSVISSGTEKMKVDESKLSLVGKARARPDQVRKVVDSVNQQGLSSTYRKVMNRLDSYTPLGYSLVGVVVEAGDESGYEVGQRVACGGNKYALHAEYNYVPANLCVPVPDEVDPRHAAFATVGSIAMQGFRQAAPQLGEVSLVIGLGLVGQLLVQLLNSAGIRAIGLDVSPERCQLAEKAGAHACGAPGGPSEERAVAELMRLTDGAGADHIFLTAGTASREPVLTAAKLARDRAVIVDIGKCNLDLPWNAYYEKELELRFSRSYGPGRYDPEYEEGGRDYPIGYVRWTEGRNMASFIDLVEDRRLDIESLIDETFPFDQAAEVYQRLHDGELNAVGVLFQYPEPEEGDPLVRAMGSASPRIATGSSIGQALNRPVRLGVIGAGNYATTMLLPHLAESADVELQTVATASSLSAITAQKRFEMPSMTTDYRTILDDPSIDAVLVATRHDSHAKMVGEALEAGKAVFVEKPLAVTEQQLGGLIDIVERTGNGRIMVGFNRRFAPMLNGLRSWAGYGDAPATRCNAKYVVSAGKLGADSWYAEDGQGSRFVGEGCHFVDTLSWWMGEEPVSLFAAATEDDVDNVEVTLWYPSGSIGTISYLTNGSTRYPKENFTVFGSGKVHRMRNFSAIESWGSGARKKSQRAVRGIDKGQAAQLEAWVSAVKTGQPMPIPFESLVATTRATFAVGESLAQRQPVRLV